MNPPRNRYSIIYLLLFIAIIAMVVYNFQQQASAQNPLTFTEVANDIKQGLVTRVTEDDNTLRVIYADAGSQGIEKISHIDTNSPLISQLKDMGVTTDQLSKVKIEFK